MYSALTLIHNHFNNTINNKMYTVLILINLSDINTKIIYNNKIKY